MKEFVKNLLLSILGYFLIGYPITLLFGAVVALTGKDPLTAGLFMEAFKMDDCHCHWQICPVGRCLACCRNMGHGGQVRDRAWMYKTGKEKCDMGFHYLELDELSAYTGIPVKELKKKPYVELESDIKAMKRDKFIKQNNQNAQDKEYERLVIKYFTPFSVPAPLV